MFKNRLLVLCVCLVGCNELQQKVILPAIENNNVFTIAVSEYPSWSTYFVADEMGIINGKEGEQSQLELKYGVDIVLKEADYDTCIQYYGTKTVDATCITNMDILAPAKGRPGVAVLATSTSNGADALLSSKASTLEELKGSKVYGLDKSVSEYLFYRAIEKNNLNFKDYEFLGMDPASAAQSLQTNSPTVESIVVWNPFKQSTLENRKDVKVVLDSSIIPGEIIDMVVVGQDVLDRPKAEDFCKCLCEAFYQVCEKMNDETTREQTLVALGAKFSDLNAEQMAVCCTETQFYKTPEEGVKLFESEELKETMNSVTSFCVDKEICDIKPIINYKNSDSEFNLLFDSSYMKSLK